MKPSQRVFIATAAQFPLELLGQSKTFKTANFAVCTDLYNICSMYHRNEQSALWVLDSFSIVLQLLQHIVKLDTMMITMTNPQKNASKT
jgi:hypothetical protein